MTPDLMSELLTNIWISGEMIQLLVNRLNKEDKANRYVYIHPGNDLDLRWKGIYI